jgi:hypothetical protein
MAPLDARKSGSFKINDAIEIHRLGFGAMRITGPRVCGHRLTWPRHSELSNICQRTAPITEPGATASADISEPNVLFTPQRGTFSASGKCHRRNAHASQGENRTAGSLRSKSCSTISGID